MVGSRREAWTRGFGKGYRALATRSPISYHEYVAKSATDLPRAVVEDIRKDITRTNVLVLPEQESTLFQVLQAYAVRNGRVGYCQGMHLIASQFVVNLVDASDVFWALTLIVEELVPEYYTPAMSGLLIDHIILEGLMASHLPRVFAHFKDHQVDAGLFCTKWFVGFFVLSLPLPVVERIWDTLADAVYSHANATSATGSVLMSAALAVLHQHSEQLFQQLDMASILTCLRRATSSTEPSHAAFCQSFDAFLAAIDTCQVHNLREEFHHDRFMSREAAEVLRGREALGWALPLPSEASARPLPVDQGWRLPFRLPPSRDTEWDISFGPGPVGITLAASNRSGYPVVHGFVSPDCVEKRCGSVRKGDILVRINAMDCASQPLAQVLAKLHRLADQPRTLRFRRITLAQKLHLVSMPPPSLPCSLPPPATSVTGQHSRTISTHLVSVLLRRPVPATIEPERN